MLASAAPVTQDAPPLELLAEELREAQTALAMDVPAEPPRPSTR